MKTEEQVKEATRAINLIKDYIELGRTQKKLKINENAETLESMLEDVTKELKSIVEGL